MDEDFLDREEPTNGRPPNGFLPPSELEDDGDDLDSSEQALFSRIPFLSHPRKMSYLSFRACGFMVKESCDLAGISLRTLFHWRNSDPEFLAFETTRLRELQDRMADDVIRFEFLRNMRLVLKKDFRILWKGLYAPNQMSKQEWAYLMKIRSHYTTQDLLALQRALMPEPEAATAVAMASVTVMIGEKEVATIQAKQAAAAALLEKFTVNQKYTVEGEVIPPEEPSPNGDGNRTSD